MEESLNPINPTRIPKRMVLIKWGIVTTAVIQRVSIWDHLSALLINIMGSQWSGRIAWAALTRKAPTRMLSTVDKVNGAREIYLTPDQ
jgi:hypothetical protein